MVDNLFLPVENLKNIITDHLAADGIETTKFIFETISIKKDGKHIIIMEEQDDIEIKFVGIDINIKPKELDGNKYTPLDKIKGV